MLTIPATIALLCGGAPSIEAPPVAVTVYPDRAWVERAVTVELAAGAQEVVIGPLPEVLDADSLQASASGPAAVTDVSFRQRRVSTPAAQRNALAAALRDAEDKLLQVMNAAAVLESEQAFIEGMHAKAVKDASDAAGTAALDTAVIKRQMEFIATELGRILNAGIQQRRDQEAAQATVNAARAALNASGGTTRVVREAVVRLQVARATSSTITLSGLESNAAWSPVYDARIDAATGDVVLDYRGAVVQMTGEPWKDVQIVLSTAEPGSSLEPPSVAHWVVDKATPPPPMAATAGGRTTRARGTFYANDSMAEPAMAESSMGLLLGAAFHKSISAQVGGSPVNVTYTLPGRVDVPSDGQADRRLRIGTTSLDGTLVHLAVPSKTAEVYLMAEATNPGPYMLLPGPTSLFVDGGFVGRTDMPVTAPGEPVRLPFGPLPSLSTKRNVKTRNATTGFWKDTSQYLQDVTIVLENSSDQPVVVRVMDHRPVSRNEKIKVTLENMSDPLSTDAEYVRDRLPKGVLRWDIEVPAHAVGDKARTLSWTLDVRWPEDMSIEGL
jgi:uncharacterized protein (TIGR02231 family)